MQKHRVFRGYFTLVIALLLGGVTLRWSAAQTQPVFRIAVLDEERGPIATGARLAVEELNAVGGVRGADGTFFQLEVVVFAPDTDGNLQAAINSIAAANNFIVLMGPETTEALLNNLPALQSLNLPILTPAIGDTILATDASGRIFRTRAAEVLHGRALADYLISGSGYRQIATVQLDIASTAGIIGFSSAAATFGVQPQPALLLQTPEQIGAIVNGITAANPQAVVVYGPPELAGQLYLALRQVEWSGAFAYNQSERPEFRDSVPVEQLNGILGVTTWPLAALDAASTRFRDAYVRTFGLVPGAVQAASFDGVQLLALAIGLPGELQTNLRQLNNVNGVQGLLRPAQLGRGELSDNVAVVQYNRFGGLNVDARYVGSQRLPDDVPVVVTENVPTATPDGVVITVRNQVINVRSGPGTDYEILGQLRQGEQARVIGTSQDLQWVVIEFRATQGWMFVDLLDIFGDLRTLPIIAPPPTPTPLPATLTPTAAPIADIVIDAAVANPSPIVPGAPFNVSVTVRNSGSVPSPQFAIAATFPPNNVFASAIVGGLAPGQSVVANLTGTLTNTGTYSVVIVADLNNDIQEGSAGEANNNFGFTYTIDRQILIQSSRTLVAGESFDLEGNGVAADITWNAGATALDTLGSARLGIISGVNFSTVHYDLISTATVNLTSIARTSMGQNTIIGIITADGNRGVIRIDDLPGNQMILTYRVYRP